MSDRYPPLPSLSPQDREYARIVVTQPWQPVPQIQTQEANAARIAALEAGLSEARAAMQRAHDKAQTVAHYDAVGILERAIVRIDALLHGDACTG